MLLHDIEEEENEHSLGYHRSIRVMKNLQICHDCHSFMEHVSDVFDRDIIIRDQNRFHHFIKGSCS